MSKGYRRYLANKAMWFFATLAAAIVLNFFLPRLMPGDPVSAIMGRMMMGTATEAEQIRLMLEHYVAMFGLDRPLYIQFLTYVGNIFRFEFGQSFSMYPREVSDIILTALPWTIALQLPSILVGWFLGNILGAIAAYVRKGFDKIMIPVALFVSGIPAFGMAVILMSIFAINLGVLPAQGGYPHTAIPAMSFEFFRGVLYHYHLPFWTLVLIAIGGQAIGMRSMGIYELNADYVKYARFMGIKDSKIVLYVFRNAVLPQVTGLALQIGTIMGGALVAERVFTYPGIGNTLFLAVTQNDYPLVAASTFVITLMVLIVVFLLDLLYGVIDPRVKAAVTEGGVE
jgi:peptide/nickel transport system permease protein